MLIAALGFGIYVWAKIQALQSGPVPEERVEIVEKEAGPQSVGQEKNEMPQVKTTDTPEEIVVAGDQLTNTQKTTLETLGLETDSFTITPQTIACAEGELGKVRLDEIVAGSAPGPIESLKLLGCTK